MRALMGCLLCLGCLSADPGDRATTAGKVRPLPAAALTGMVSVEEAIAQRRSVRSFKDVPLTPAQIGQLCWAGQGITDRARGFRASPSAGALYPIELYVVTKDGVDRYRAEKHELQRRVDGDRRPDLKAATHGQEAVGAAPMCMVVAAVLERTARKYGERAQRYCLLEAGHVAQNVLLQATAMKLAGVPVGAFDDAQVRLALKMPDNCEVLYLLPIGSPP